MYGLKAEEGGWRALVSKAVPEQRAGLGNEDHGLTMQFRCRHTLSLILWVNVSKSSALYCSAKAGGSCLALGLGPWLLSGKLNVCQCTRFFVHRIL